MTPMLKDRMTSADAERVAATYFVEGPSRGRALSSFWTLLVLSAIIAAAGVVADSAATVIGAMIVAPLMRPILGAAAALVLARRRQVLINLGLVAGGALAVIALGYLLGVVTQIDIVAATNGQVAGRVSPRLIDLLAALATGLVGVFAVIRSDISDTLPGVAIAISLVPPLAVVGLTLEAGATGEAGGALLLFGTNVAAIIATGTVVLLLAGFRQAALESGITVRALTGRSLAVVAGSLVVVAVPLTIGTREVVLEQLTIGQVRPITQAWAEPSGWEVAEISLRGDVVHVVAVGPDPAPDPADLRAGLDAGGIGDLTLDVTLLEGVSEELPASR